MADAYDYLIAGGGTAGCVLAARLSADPAKRVMLLEAGPDFPSGSLPASVSSGRFRSHHDPDFWAPPLALQPSAGAGNEVTSAGFFRVPQVIGGGSSVNGMHVQRGLPADYDAWAGAGVQGWSWAELLPYFRRLEKDLDFDGPEHGDSGPITIRRIAEDRWSGLSRAVVGALMSRGLPRWDDLATAPGDGVGPVPLNLRQDERASVPASYLDATVRRRPNLTIQSHARAVRVLVSEGRALGLEVEVNGAHRELRAAETILSAGVIGSPLLLLRSGIGPRAQLESCGIPLHADRPGVGRLLLNHAHLSLGVHLRPRGRQHPSAVAPCTVVARYSSGLRGAPRCDMVLNLWERTPGALEWDPLSRQFAVMMVLLNAARSAGDLRLDPATPGGPPQLRFNTLDDALDFERIMQGVRMVADLLRTPGVAACVNDAFFPVPNRANEMLNGYGWRARAVSALGAAALSGPAWLRRRALRTQGMPLAKVVADERLLREWVRRSTRPASHATSTCRMGDVADRYAVTDSRCRVIGVANLRVVDCSIFPTSVRAGTHIPAIMAAERASDLILADARARRTDALTC